MCLLLAYLVGGLKIRVLSTSGEDMRPSAPVRRQFDGGVARVKWIYQSSAYESLFINFDRC